MQFLENELQSQKQKFWKLKSFTKSLLIAVKNRDRKKQQVRKLKQMKLLESSGIKIVIGAFVSCQELLASLPQKVNEDWDLGLENHSVSGAIQKESSVSEEEEDMDQMRL